MIKKRLKDWPVIKKWYSDDEKRLCLFGPEWAMVEADFVKKNHVEIETQGVLLIHFENGDDNTSCVEWFETMQEAISFAERWCK